MKYRSKMKKVLLIINIVVLNIGMIWMVWQHLQSQLEEGKKIKAEFYDFSDEELSETGVTYPKEAIPDKETAIRVGTAVFDATMRQTKAMREYEVLKVYYDVSNKLWIVGFGPREERHTVSVQTEGWVYISIEKEDGAVIRIWEIDEKL